MEVKMPHLSSDRVERRGRSAVDAGIELRTTGSGSPQFVGHAAVVNTRTAIGNPLTWGFYEEISSDAFTRTLDGADVRLLVDHDSAKIVARQSAGDLRLAMDSVGLGVDADLDSEVSYVRDLARNLEKRRITGMSFGFMVRKDNWSKVDVTAQDDKGNDYTTQADLRVIEDLDLIEVSAVTFPAYEETDAALRALSLAPELVAQRAEMVRHAKIDLPPRVLGRALDLMQELRAGKVLSAANINLLQSVLDQLAAADEAFDPLVSMVVSVDEALDAAQADISSLIGVTDPDQNDPDEGTGDGQRAKGFPVPPADYVQAFALRHGLTGR
jgi:HK97 family phage prohead protease